MRTHKDKVGYRISIKMWHGEKPSERAVSRHDMVHLTLDAFEGSVCATAYADRGFPILQPYAVAFSLGEDLRQRIIDQQDSPTKVENTAEAISAAVLSELMNAELVTSGQANAPNIDQVGIWEEFQQLLGASGSDWREHFPPVPESKLARLELPSSVADAGVEVGIFQKAGPSETIRSKLNIRFDTNISGFKAVSDMRTDRENHGIRVPDGFDEIDMEAAGLALKAVHSPLAVVICAYGDVRHPWHAKRMQAAQAYPLLAEYFVLNPELLETIDSGGQLRQMVSAHTKLSAGQLRRLGKLETPLPAGRLFEFGETVRSENQVGVNRTRTHSIRGELRLSAALELLRPLETNWIPDTEQDWTSLTDIASACALPLNCAFDVPVHQVFATSKGNWSGLRSILASAAQVPDNDFDRRQIALCTIDAMDAVDDFSQTVVLPLVHRSITDAGERIPYPTHEDLEEARQLSFQFLIGNSRNIAGSLFSMARRWIARIPALIEAEERTATDRVDAVARKSGTTDRWPALAEDFIASNGLVVRNLVSVKQLKEESSRLKHCVGRLYLRKSKQGKCHIFSVRDRHRPRSHSTIELTPPATCVEQLARAEFEIVQHKGGSNRRPSDNAQIACKEWLQAIRSGQLELHLKEVLDWNTTEKSQESWNETARRSVSSNAVWDDILGTQWKDAAVQSAVWNEWREHILRRSTDRPLTPEIVYSLPKAREFLCKLNPRAGELLSQRAIIQQTENLR